MDQNSRASLSDLVSPMRRSSLDGLAFTDKAGKVWCVFAPGWRVWRWAGHLWRIVHGMPSTVQPLKLPDGEVVVRAEPAGPLSAAIEKLSRKAPVGGDRGTS